MLYEHFNSWTGCLYGSAALALGAAVIALGLRARASGAPSATAVGVPATAK